MHFVRRGGVGLLIALVARADRLQTVAGRERRLFVLAVFRRRGRFEMTGRIGIAGLRGRRRFRRLLVADILEAVIVGLTFQRVFVVVVVVQARGTVAVVVMVLHEPVEDALGVLLRRLGR